MTKDEVIKKFEDEIFGAMMATRKEKFLDYYGGDAEDVMRGRAHSMAKEKYKKLEEKQTKMDKKKIRKMIEDALSAPVSEEKTPKYDDAPELTGKQGKNLPDALQKAIIKKKGGKINENKVEALMELRNILDELQVLGDQAREIIKQSFPKMLSKADAYGAFEFGSSANRYDTTLESIIEEIEEYYDEEEEMMQEDLDLGHEDYEPKMLQGDLYRIGKYAMEIYKMLEPFDTPEMEVDLPHWWQSKIIKAKDYLVSAKHYLDFELKEPAIDAMVAEASKGTLNYFNDLKYYYQKAFRYLDVEEREEYKQLAKDFFSRLQIDDKVRAVGLEEGAVEIMDSYNRILDLLKKESRALNDDDSYALGLKLRAWFEKNIIKENMSLDDQAKAYYLAKVKSGEIDTLPEDPKAAFLVQMTKDQMDHDRETLDREGGLGEAITMGEQFKVGDKVTYLGNPAEITFVGKDQMDRTYYSVSYDKGNGKTKASNLYNRGGEIKPLDEKKLTKAELKKREEIAKAIEKDQPKMDMAKKMAIATDIAKRVAEGLPKGYFKKMGIGGKKMNESFDKFVDKLQDQGYPEEVAKKIAGAVNAAYVKKYK